MRPVRPRVDAGARAARDDLGLERAWWLKSYGDYTGGRWGESTVAIEQDSDTLGAERRRSRRCERAIRRPGPDALSIVRRRPDAIARVEEELRQGATGESRSRAPGMAERVPSSLRRDAGRLDDARRVYAGAVAIYEELDLRQRLATRGLVGAQIELLADDPRPATSYAWAPIGLLPWARSGSPVHCAHADLLCTQGASSGGTGAVLEVSTSAPEDDRLSQVYWRCTLARVLVRRAETDDAEPLVLEAVRLTDGTDCPNLRLAALCAMAELETAHGRSGEARHPRGGEVDHGGKRATSSLSDRSKQRSRSLSSPGRTSATGAAAGSGSREGDSEVMGAYQLWAKVGTR